MRSREPAAAGGRTQERPLEVAVAAARNRSPQLTGPFLTNTHMLTVMHAIT